MLYKYLIDKEKEASLKKINISKRVHETYKELIDRYTTNTRFDPQLANYQECIGLSNIYTYKDSLRQRKMLGEYEEEIIENYIKPIHYRLINGKHNSTATINNNTIQIPIKSQDILLLSGEIASQILTKEEMKKWKDYGFEDKKDYWATIGAIMINELTKIKTNQEATIQSYDNIRIYEIKCKETSLELIQYDHHPFERKDAFDTPMSYMPIHQTDLQAIYPAKKERFLEIILNYANQEKININSKIKKSTEPQKIHKTNQPYNIFANLEKIGIIELNEKWLLPFITNNGDFLLSDTTYPQKNEGFTIYKQDIAQYINALEKLIS
ncbi:hypothetical protein K9L97_04345 [Candidatus Woesearchaeota archaeon]|nr:hypothetical protein [Candidatus Woesearchaeota archaeon]